MFTLQFHGQFNSIFIVPQTIGSKWRPLSIHVTLHIMVIIIMVHHNANIIVGAIISSRAMTRTNKNTGILITQHKAISNSSSIGDKVILVLFKNMKIQNINE